jgi:hypothetical protein
MFLSSDKRRRSVRGQEHRPIGIRAGRGFFILWVQVLVLCSGQELVSIAENGQEHVPIATKLFVVQAVMQPTVLLELGFLQENME